MYGMKIGNEVDETGTYYTEWSKTEAFLKHFFKPLKSTLAAGLSGTRAGFCVAGPLWIQGACIWP